MPGAYGQRGWGGGGGGPQIQYPIGGATWPGGGYFSGGSGGAGAGTGGMDSFLRRRLRGSAPLPRGPGPTPPDVPTGGRGEPQIPRGIGRPEAGTGVLGDLGIGPEQWVQNRQNRLTPFDELQNLVDTRNRVNAGMGRGGAIGQMGQGAGFGGQDDMLRRLLEARMQGGGF